MLAGIISTWTAACGGDDHVVVVLDGARFPLKAREHARRGITSASREQLLADAIQLDEEDKSAEADAKYKELSYPVPPSVDAWLVAHCMAFGVPLIVAPFEADSQCAALARSGAVDAVISFDGDLAFYSGVTHLIAADPGANGVYWNVRPESDVVGHKLGSLDLSGWSTYDLRTVGLAAGTDYDPGGAANAEHTARRKAERADPYAAVRCGYLTELFSSPRFSGLDAASRFAVLLHAVHFHERHVLAVVQACIVKKSGGRAHSTHES